MTDINGKAVWEIETKPFGDGTSVIGTATLNFRFPGQYYDKSTGLHQNWWRDYKNEIGRYIEADPIGLKSDLNLFTYVRSNPLSYKDPKGLIPNFGGGVFGTLVIFAGGAGIDHEECCKGGIKYNRTLLRVSYGLGLGLEIKAGSGGPGGNLQIVGPNGDCKDYRWKNEQQITCFEFAYAVGLGFCDTGTNSLDTMNLIASAGGSAYSVFVRTKILQEVANGKCCNPK